MNALKKIIRSSRKNKQYQRFTRSKLGNFGYIIMLLAAGLFSMVPLIYSVITSFKPLDELLIFPPTFWVQRPTFYNYLALPSILDNLSVPLSRYIFNSVFISITVTVFHVFIASAAGFTLSKSKIKFRKTIFLIVQFSLLYSAYTLQTPRYLIFSGLKMVDTYLVYILPLLPSSMGIFLMKQFIDVSVPNALIEAARIDGAGTLRIFWSIVMSGAKPAWLTLSLFIFREAWSVQPSGTIFSEKLKTLTSAAAAVTGSGIVRMGSAMAITVLMMIPPIIVYLVSQRSVIQTMSHSGIK